MSDHGPIYMPGDAVYYVGEKFNQKLTNKEGKPLKGYIHASVTNQDGAWVVWFPDTKESDSFIMSAANLSKARPPKVERAHEGPIVEHMPVRRKMGDES